MYVLVVRVTDEIPVETRSLRTLVAPGVYAYIGSACGPGGLRARILRHARRRKRVWWHIDRVTTSGKARILGVAYCTTRTCGPPAEASVAGCLASRGYLPVRRFGSSDDPKAESHFYRAPPTLDPQRIPGDAIECLKEAVGGACRYQELEELE